jgi:hypothetical protein
MLCSDTKKHAALAISVFLASLKRDARRVPQFYQPFYRDGLHPVAYFPQEPCYRDFRELAIEWRDVGHRSITTVQQGGEVVEKISRHFPNFTPCKVLLLSADKGRTLIIHLADARARESKLESMLKDLASWGVVKGCATPFMLSTLEAERLPRVSVRVSANLAKAQCVGFHPLRNDVTTVLTMGQLQRYLLRFLARFEECDGQSTYSSDPQARFWNTQAQHYGTASLTTTCADEELEILRTRMPKSKVLALHCIGCADGTRDPLALIDELSEPVLLGLADVSPEMMQQATANVRKRASCWSQVDCSVGPVFTLTPPEGVRAHVFLSVYRLSYLEQALELYRTSATLVGTQFQFRAIAHDGAPLASYAPLKDMGALLARPEEQNWLAIELLSEKGFLSKYFHPTAFRQYLGGIFGHEPRLHEAGPRHLVYEFVLNPEAEHACIVTCINNALGNMPMPTLRENLLHMAQVYGQ